MEKTIGRIIEVKGLHVKAKLFNLLPPFLVENGKRESAPKINGFVKTRIGIDIIICQVVGEYSEEINGAVKDHYLDLQVKGYFSNGKFIQGLRILPIVSANIELLDFNDYNNIYSGVDESTLCIGYDLFDENKCVNVNINKLIPSHIGVFGNTGSGKSNTLTKILVEYHSFIKRFNTDNGKFLIFDLNNEYGNDAICSKNDKKIYKLSTKKDSEIKIPLDIETLDEDDFVVLMNASQKTQAPVVKSAYKSMKEQKNSKKSFDEKHYLNFMYNIITNGRKALFFSIKMYLEEYFTGLNCFKYNNKYGVFFVEDNSVKYYAEDNYFKDKLKEINIKKPKDTLDLFLFELYFSIARENENGLNIDFVMPLISRARKLISDFRKIFDFTGKIKDIFEDKNICVVQLSNVNKDMKEIVPSIVANNIFRRLANEKEEKGVRQIINIVVDEAHNILYDSKSDILTHESVLSVFEKIVKEGRKFGLFLMLASQRPSDISETIISQLHNYFIHKLVNPSDIQRIRKAVAYMDDSSLNFITILGPGECILSGTAFQMPTFVYINQVNLENRPNSEDVILIGDNGLFTEKRKVNNDKLTKK